MCHKIFKEKPRNTKQWKVYGSYSDCYKMLKVANSIRYDHQMVYPRRVKSKNLNNKQCYILYVKN